MKTELTSLTFLAALPILLAGCSSGGSGGSPSTARSTVSNVNSAPTISGEPSDSVLNGEIYQFRPSASDSDGDLLTFSLQGRPAWMSLDDSTGELSGRPTAADVGSYNGLILSVSDGKSSSSLPEFSIEVVQNQNGSITVTWDPPTANIDGSALSDLAGYKIYYGKVEDQYDNVIDVNNPGLTSYVVENVTPSTYYIVATSYNQDGIESPFSNVVEQQVN